MIDESASEELLWLRHGEISGRGTSAVGNRYQKTGEDRD
jgi:hypothetical protein